MQSVAFVKIEVHINRGHLLELRDGRGAANADEIARINLSAPDAAGERRRHVGVAQINLRYLHLGAGLIAQTQLLVQVRFGDVLLIEQLYLAIILGLGLD